MAQRGPRRWVPKEIAGVTGVLHNRGNRLRPIREALKKVAFPRVSTEKRNKNAANRKKKKKRGDLETTPPDHKKLEKVLGEWSVPKKKKKRDLRKTSGNRN